MVMRKHQRYFPVKDEAGALMPVFITVANGTISPAVVIAGDRRSPQKQEPWQLHQC